MSIAPQNIEIPNYTAHHRALVEDYQSKLSSQDDHLKSAMNALNEKLKFYENIEMEKNHVSDHLHQSEKGREELRLTLLEAAEKVKEE